MTSPYDPGRPEDRPGDQPGFPSAPPPQDYGQQYPQGGQQWPQGGQPGQSHQGFPSAPDHSQQQQYAGGPGYQGGYGSMPGYGQPGRPAPTPPKTVVQATRAMYAAIVISLLSLVFTLSDSEGYKDVLRDANTEGTDIDVDALYTGVVIFAVVLTLLIAALYVFLAINILKGRNWARITAWVVIGLFALIGLLGLTGDAPAAARILGVLLLLANIATIVLLALRPSNEFFAASKGPRY
jgi:hypothetical protein